MNTNKPDGELIDTTEGCFNLFIGVERSDLHHYTRPTYEIVGPDGWYMQQYEKGEMRRRIAKRYGVTQKWVRENIL